MKRMIAKILIMTLLVLPFGTYSVSATEYKEEIGVENIVEHVIDTTDERTSEYNKLHFYFDVEEHGTIDDVGELEKAIDAIPKPEANQGKEAGISTYNLTNNTQESNEVSKFIL